MQETAYNLTVDEALKALESRRAGLTAAEVTERLEKFGHNALLREVPGVSGGKPSFSLGTPPRTY